MSSAKIQVIDHKPMHLFLDINEHVSLFLADKGENLLDLLTPTVSMLSGGQSVCDVEQVQETALAGLRPTFEMHVEAAVYEQESGIDKESGLFGWCQDVPRPSVVSDRLVTVLIQGSQFVVNSVEDKLLHLAPIVPTPQLLLFQQSHQPHDHPMNIRPLNDLLRLSVNARNHVQGLKRHIIQTAPKELFQRLQDRTGIEVILQPV